MFDFDIFKKSVAQLQDRLKTIQREIEELQYKRNVIAAAPAARSDVKQMLERWVDLSAAEFVPAMRRTVETFIRQPATMSGNKRVQSVITLHGELPGARPEEPPMLHVDRVLCALFGPQVKLALAAAVEQMQWPVDEQPEGLPMSDRAKQLALIDQEIEKLYGEQSTLRERAQEAGLII